MKRYEEAAEQLRAMAAELPTGARMPTDPELSKMMDFSRGTIRRALDIVEHEGVIQSVHGRGRFVLGPAGERGNRLDAAYERIAHDIQEQLANEPAGKQLPHVNDLAMRFDVSNVTVRRVLRDLARGGLIHTRDGRTGYFVGGP